MPNEGKYSDSKVEESFRQGALVIRHPKQTEEEDEEDDDSDAKGPSLSEIAEMI